MAPVARGPVVHWDDVTPRTREVGYIKADWSHLGYKAGSVTVGANRLQIPPGRMPNPPHLHGAEEEIFYVLSGSGLSWQDGETFEVRAGDCIVHVANTKAHTLRAGEDGLDVLAFGQRVAVELCNLPRAETGWLGPRWVPTAGPDPWHADAELGPPDFPAPSARPSNIVNVADAHVTDDQRETVGRRVRRLGAEAGSVKTGLRHVEVTPGKLNGPPHCHSAEEELMVVLGGEGTLLLGDDEIAVRAGSVVSRPAGTGVAHAFRGGEQGLELLQYGTRETNDIAYFPRSGKISLRGIGITGRIEPLGFWDGEE